MAAILRPALMILAIAFPAAATDINLPGLSALTLHNTAAELAGDGAQWMLHLTLGERRREEGLAVLDHMMFGDGTIELEVSGAPAVDADDDARGFVGIAFHMREEGRRFETIYLRPTNGRAPDQQRRNHSVQYESMPDWPWSRLRRETPGRYESYTDLEPGVWTRMRVVVKGSTAALYVGLADQPCLIVQDLKLGAGEGGLAFWVGPGTDAYFRNLTITRESEAAPQSDHRADYPRASPRNPG